MEASPFHHHHHAFLLDQSLLYPNPTATITMSTGFSDELLQQPHEYDLFIPSNATTEVSAHSHQVSIGNNFQSSDFQMPMAVHGHEYDRTMPPTNSYGLTKKTCKKVRNQNKSNIDQENKRESKEGQTGYVYVRARRGEATDSHSLAERVRREKISEKMKALQAIVPGCDKITGKVPMLEEVINYVQSLQNEIQFLSSKLACVNPTYDFEPEFDASMLKPHQNMTTDQEQLLSFQEHQMVPNMVFQDDREVVWDLEEQRQEPEDSFAIINSFNSFY